VIKYIFRSCSMQGNLEKVPFRPISALLKKIYHWNISHMPAVKFSSRLDLERKLSFYKVPVNCPVERITPGGDPMNRTRWLQETQMRRFEQSYDGWQSGRLSQEDVALLVGMCSRTSRRYFCRNSVLPMGTGKVLVFDRYHG
jgi:hypothetical protein